MTFPKGKQCPSCAWWEHDDESRGRAVVDVSEWVPGERARLVVQGRRTNDNRMCTLAVIHKCSGAWAIQGLGNPGVRLTTLGRSALAETIVVWVR